MSFRNLNNNVYLFDIDDRDGDMPQLGISASENNIYINVVQRTETNASIQYELLHQMGFDIPSFINALRTALISSYYDSVIDIFEKEDSQNSSDQQIAHVISLIEKLPQIEELADEIEELTSDTDE